MTLGLDGRGPNLRFPDMAAARLFCLVVACVIGAIMTAAAASQAQTRPVDIDFDIPSQSLADALVAYGAASGLQVFYDGSLADGHRSATVRGMYAPMPGLQKLLRGTGYLPQPTANPDTITIVKAPSSAESAAPLRPFEPYFAILQARVGAALCRVDEAKPGSEQIIVSVWLAPSGVISHARLLSHSPGNEIIAAAIQGLQLRDPPPAGLPQPVTMVIFPPAEGDPVGCATADRRAGN